MKWQIFITHKMWLLVLREEGMKQLYLIRMIISSSDIFFFGALLPLAVKPCLRISIFHVWLGRNLAMTISPLPLDLAPT